jgi:uncharacterized protein YbjQ (UPF0145 family)
MSGLSGNEMYCAAIIGLTPGTIIVGNSVYSMGILGGIASKFKTAVGGEIKSFTVMVESGRRESFLRLKNEQVQLGAFGIAGVTSELVFHGNNIEFLSVGSALMSQSQTTPGFTTSADAQELFCLTDAFYEPVSFVFGNVAYSIGMAGHAMGSLRQMAKGEVASYSDIFNTTRNLALQRITDEAKALGANSVVGIRTTIVPFGIHGVQEMVMIGTAAKNSELNNLVPNGVITSDLTAEETWNIAKLNYLPMQLVLGTSVYSLGIAGGIKSSIQELMHGEVDSMTKMVYGARENSINKLKQQAAEIGADDVLGIKTYIYDLGNSLVEFLAIGTTVKHMPQEVKTRSQQLPPQAIIRDKTTFINIAETQVGYNLSEGS